MLFNGFLQLHVFPISDLLERLHIGQNPAILSFQIILAMSYMMELSWLPIFTISLFLLYTLSGVTLLNFGMMMLCTAVEEGVAGVWLLLEW